VQLRAAFLLLPLCACRAPVSRFEFTDAAMGTEFRIVLYAADEDAGFSAAGDAFARIRQLDWTFSDYDDDSEARELVELGAGTHAASDELCEVAALALEVTRASGGAFDVTVGPVTRLWRRALRRGTAPDEERLVQAREAVGADKLGVDVQAGTLTLRADDMRLDFGGIAKGYALDEALRVLATHGIERALVDGGGDVACGAPPPGEAGWLVAIDAPPDLAGGAGAAGDRGRVAVRIAHAALATSGDLARGGVVDGAPRSHVLDPRTGVALPASPRRASALVTRGPGWCARPGALADAVASALLVLGADEGLAFAEGTEGVDVRWVERVGDGLVFRATPGFPRLVSSGLDDARASDAPPDPSPDRR